MSIVVWIAEGGVVQVDIPTLRPFWPIGDLDIGRLCAYTRSVELETG